MLAAFDERTRAETQRGFVVHCNNDNEDDGIDFEDIVCCRCGSGVDREGNDIVLCDGVCGLAYHQRCLDPPLLVMPEEDEGWLCPLCDVKADIMKDINNYFDTEYGIETELKDVELWSAESAPSDAVGRPLDRLDSEEGGAGVQRCADLLLHAEFPSDDEEDDDYDGDSSGEADDDGEASEGVVDSDDSSDDSDDTGDDFDDYSDDDDDESDESEQDEENPGAPSPEHGDRRPQWSMDTSRLPSPYRLASVSSLHAPPPRQAAGPPRDQSSKATRERATPRTVSVGKSPLPRSRRRKKVDYKALSMELFGSVSCGSDDEDEWNPSP